MLRVKFVDLAEIHFEIAKDAAAETNADNSTSCYRSEKQPDQNSWIGARTELSGQPLAAIDAANLPSKERTANGEAIPFRHRREERHDSRPEKQGHNQEPVKPAAGWRIRRTWI